MIRLPFDPAIRQAAFHHTIPVMMGYLAMGFAAGVVLAAGCPVGAAVGWGFLTSATSISGALQFMLANWLHNPTPLGEILIATFCLNLRYAMYGLSLIERFQGVPWRQKFYLIWSITDETYALEVQNEVPAGHSSVDYCLAVALFDHLYWIAGVVAGCAVGAALPFNTRGIDFAMTALFWVILTDQCRKQENRIPALIGAAATFLAQLLLPKSGILIGSLAIIIVSLLLLRRKLDRKESAA